MCDQNYNPVRPQTGETVYATVLAEFGRDEREWEYSSPPEFAAGLVQEILASADSGEPAPTRQDRDTAEP